MSYFCTQFLVIQVQLLSLSTTALSDSILSSTSTYVFTHSSCFLNKSAWQQPQKALSTPQKKSCSAQSTLVQQNHTHSSLSTLLNKYMLSILFNKLCFLVQKLYQSCTSLYISLRWNEVAQTIQGMLMYYTVNKAFLLKPSKHVI